MNRVFNSLAVAIGLFATVIVVNPLLAAPAKPNILVILADDLGYSDLGCYGSEIETPVLDKLAGGGLRFTQFYNTARCWPSRGAVLTGYYAQQIRRDAVPGVKSGGQGTRPEWAPLLPQRLVPLGYRSYVSGKWHVDGTPAAGGFLHSYLLEDQNRFFRPQNVVEDGRKLPPVPEGYYATTAVADHAIKCLQEHAANHQATPFFHYLCFISPHFPLQALPDDIARYRQRYRVGWDAIRISRHTRMKELGIVSCELSALEKEVGPPYPFPDAIKTLGPGEINRPLPWTELSPEQQEFQATKMAIHAAMIDRMDREIGRVIDQLRKMNVLENTLILFMSDNGASAEIMVRGDGHDPTAPLGSAETYLCLGPGFSSTANTPLRRHKTWVHEGGISTPLVAHWPARIAARGELRHNPGHLIDLVPTLLELAGADRPETWNGKPAPSLPGKSLVPALTKDGSVTRDCLWWLHEGNRAIRVGDYKLVAADKEPWELYDLKTDRGESHNLASSLPDKARELEKLWNTRWEEFQTLALKDAPPPAESPAKKKKNAGSENP